MIVTRMLDFTGIEHEIDLLITQDQLDLFENGAGKVQDIFPNLSEDQREFLMTGCTPDEWDKAMFHPEAELNFHDDDDIAF